MSASLSAPPGMQAPWPTLREEIGLLEGPRQPDGQPGWTLHDPVRNRFFAINWAGFEILKRWSYADPDTIAGSVSAATTLRLEAEDVSGFVEFLTRNDLLQPPLGNSAKRFAERLDKMQGTPLKWLIHHYLFFRVPLWNPDAWLQRYLPIARLLATPLFAALTLCALVFGLWQVVLQWDGFVTSFVNTFTWSGLVSYGVALVVVKWLHELGHAFTARHLGCRVPAMGVAFLVMFPMAYTDTNETWRLKSHRQRLRVACAGILTELGIAAWAVLAWAMLPEGDLRSVAFVLATVSLLATLAINASPFLRFDGYFILSDLIDMPNLHERSFALARWHLRERLFDLREPKPEVFAPRRERALIVFAWMTWLYRLVVFIGIALLIYGLFFKLLGVVLFIVELAWFIAMPVRREVLEWKQRWPVIKRRRRSLLTALLLVLLVGVLLVPWPTRVGTSGVLKPATVLPLHAPGAAYVVGPARPADGSRVGAGELIFELAAPELDLRQRLALSRIERLRRDLASAGFDERSRLTMRSLRDELATTEAELVAIETELAAYTLRASFDGVLRDVPPELGPGQWVSAREQLGVLVAPGGQVVETYLDEAAVARVAVGDRAMFLADGRGSGAVRLTVRRVDADATRVLQSGLLTAQAGGHVLARERRDELVPERAIYRVVLAPDPGQSLDDRQVLRGDVVIHGRWESPVMPYLRNAMAVLVREFGF
jgi:putative peptide zinc metalloprotease protein